MTVKKTLSALDLIKKVRNEIENKHPPKDRILEEVKMMRFKIRPVYGDIGLLAKNDLGFLEVLWKIGKIEAIINAEVVHLSDDEKEIFFRYWQNESYKIHQSARPIRQNAGGEQDLKTVLEIEISKSGGQRKSLN